MKLTNRLLAIGGVLLALCWPGASQAQTFPPSWNSTSAYAAGDIVQYGGNWYRAMVALSAGGPYPAAAYGKWELNFVRSNTTLTIGDGQGFANLVYAWQFARNARIADAAYLHFSIVTTAGDFSEAFTEPFSLDHASGPLISIIGDNKANIAFEFKFSNGSAFTLDQGHDIGSISGLTLNGNSQANDGFSLSGNASIANISNLTIEGFNAGVSAEYSSFAGLASSVEIENCENGILADYGSTVIADGSEISLNGAKGNGLFANHKSKISDQNAQIVSSPVQFNYGVYAINGAVIDVSNSTVKGWYLGAYAYYAGFINAGNVDFTDEYEYDIEVRNGGKVNAKGATINITEINSNTSAGLNDGSYIYE